MIRSLKVLHISAISLIFTFFICSCAAENEISENVGTEDIALLIGARIDREMLSRAEVYVPEGDITTGMYYLTYPKYASGEGVANVNFDVPAAEGNGIVTTTDGRELTWKLVRTFNQTTNQRATFYLDNVKSDVDDEVVISSDQFKNTYKAAVFDSIYGKNDLLAGTLENVNYNTPRLDFTLSHQMSRLKLMVIVNNNYEEGASDFLDLTEATVTLSNIVCDVNSYDRSSMTLNNASGVSDLKIVDKENGIDWLWISKNDESTDTETSGNASTENSTQTYISQNIVLPPQQVNQTTLRPILTITTGGNNPQEFWGYLPSSMIDEAPNPSQVTTFQFLKGYAMTVRVHVNAPERMLIFQPVEIEDWLDVGTQRLNGSEVVPDNN